MSTDTITSISLQNSPEYMPRLQRIIECLAEDAGMDGDEAREVELIITEACTGSFNNGSAYDNSGRLQITFSSNDSAFTANVDDPGMNDEATAPRFGNLLKRLIGTGIDFIRNSAGFTVRMNRRRRTTCQLRKVKVKKPVSLHLN